MITTLTGPGHVGDGLAGITACLPATPAGEVVVRAGPEVRAAIQRRYPGARTLGAADPLPTAGSVGLLVLEITRHAPGRSAEVTDILVPGGVVAVVEPGGDHLIHPGPVHPEVVWRRGWPMPPAPAHSGPLRRVRRWTALRTAARRGSPGLSLHGTAAGAVTLAERIAVDLGDALGARFTLSGLLTASRTVLRFSSPDHRDVAVRLCCTDPQARLDTAERVLAEVPELAPLVLPTLAAGTVAGCPWTATTWVSGRRRHPLLSAGGSAARRGAIARTMEHLGARPTGSTAPGWAERWTTGVDLLPVEMLPGVRDGLRVLEDGLPTGWCHGDLWPGNVLVEHDRAVVIDWDNAAPEAPLGLDRVLVAALDLAHARRVTMARAAALLVDDPGTVGTVAGRPYAGWNRSVRAALALAAILQHLRNRSLHDMGAELLTTEVAVIAELAAGTGADEPSPADSREGSAVRGAGWLGLGAGVVKAAQTIVLLVLAALLTPSALGVLALGAMILNLTSAVTDLGSSTALVHWRGDVERAARSALTLALGLALLLTAGTWAAAPWLADLLHGGETGAQVIRGLMLCLPFQAVSSVSQELLRRRLAFRRRVLPEILGALLGAAVAVFLAATGTGVMSLVHGQVLGALVTMVGSWLVRPPVRPGWRGRDARGLVGYGGHLAGANLAGLVMLNVDYVIVARQLGAEPLGIYSMAFRFAYMPYLLIGAVLCGAAFAHLCRLEGRELGTAATGVAVVVATLVLPVYLGVALLAPQLELLGPEWGPAVPALRWLAAYGLLLTLLKLTTTVLNAGGHPRDSLLLELAHLGILTGLLLRWTREGVEQVALAQLVAVSVVLMASTLMLRCRVAGLDPAALRRLGPVLLGAGLMVSTALLVQQLLPWSRLSVPGLLLVGSLSLAAYLLPIALLPRPAPVPLAALPRRSP